jgi:predicted DNA-binding WGR domain protein
MSDAIHIEQRLHELEQRLHEMVAGWGRRNGRAKSGEDSPREMEEQAVERLFKEPRRNRPSGYAFDPVSAREVEREAMKRLYGDRPTVVVEVMSETDDAR